MPKRPGIVPIVEGPGDRYAVPGLLRRILGQLDRYDIAVSQAKVAHGKSNLLRERKFEQFLDYALVDDCTAILVLLDADADCPREEVVCLAQRAVASKLAVPIAIVYAKCEYETWFICSLSPEHGTAIRGRLELPAHITAPEEPEKIRSAKDWLTARMPRHRAYKEVIDQEPLTHHIELDLVREKSRSFRRLCHALEELVQAVDNQGTIVTPQFE